MSDVKPGDLVLRSGRAEPDLNSGCWLWTGCLSSSGYARMRHDGRVQNVSRIVLGITDPKVLVCHRCDTPACVNSDHLFVGSQEDNMRDCARKGRTHHRTLNHEDVKDIRQRYSPHRVSQKTLAKEYGVTPNSIGQIVRGETYRYIP